jgi:hypothetical protein
MYAQETAKAGGHTLHVIRLKGQDDAVLLSLMLQYDPAKGPGNYFDGSIKAFETVMGKYGPSVEF